MTVSGSISVQVNATPTGVTFTPSTASLPDNAAAGTTVAVVSVSMSDGSAFAGPSPPARQERSRFRARSHPRTRPHLGGRGPRQWTVTATQNGVTVSGSISVQVNATPTGVTFAPSTASLPDNAAAGTTVAVVSVSMSDGSTFAGVPCRQPVRNGRDFGQEFILARALTSADDGSRQWTVAATQNGGTVSGSMRFKSQLAPPPPPPSGPTAEWTLTQASVSGATVADASGNGNAGTVMKVR